ncbi:MAG: hypothetical protein CMJ75_18650 [Planctomycetaceae bacterium]|nr:hypothetical protein [Planctomycetaceae bacterium]
MASNFADISQAIRTKAKSVLDGAGVPTIYDNRADKINKDSRWARVTILPGAGTQASIGTPETNRHRLPGTLVIQLFEVFEKGTADLEALIDTVVDEFTEANDATVTFRTPGVLRVGRSGKFWQVNVTVPWFADRLG